MKYLFYGLAVFFCVLFFEGRLIVSPYYNKFYFNLTAEQGYLAGGTLGICSIGFIVLAIQQFYKEKRKKQNAKNTPANQ